MQAGEPPRVGPGNGPQTRLCAQGFLRKVTNDWTMQSAGALAYSVMGAATPIAIAIIAIGGVTLGTLAPGVQRQLVNGLASFFAPGNLSKEILRLALATLTRSAGPLMALAIPSALFGGSRLFTTLEGCFAIIYRTYPRGAIAQNVMALIMTLLFVAQAPLLISASSLPALLLSLAAHTGFNRLPLIAWWLHSGLLLGALGVATSVALTWVLFEVTFLVVPNRAVSFKHSWPGALLSAVLLQLFLAVFPLYLTHWMGSPPGVAGFAVILLVFFYYVAVILLLGAQFNAYVVEQIQPLPQNLAAVLHDTVATPADGD